MSTNTHAVSVLVGIDEVYSIACLGGGGNLTEWHGHAGENESSSEQNYAAVVFCFVCCCI